MAGWESASIGALCDVVNGGTPKTGVQEYWGGPHRWITPAEMGKRSTPYIDRTERTITDQGLQNSSARPLPPYSVILSSRAPIGHLVINTEPMATNQGCKGLVPRSRIDHKFLYYYLGSIVDLLNDLGTGATFKELSGGKLKEVPVPVPPLPEQRRIVAILDEAFEGIATAKANAEKNLQNARELFETYLRATFSQEGEVVQLSKCATDISDGDHAPPPKSPTGVPFITISNVDKETRRIDFSDTFTVSREYFQALKPHRRPQSGDVLYTVTGSFGIPVLVEDDGEFCFQRHIGLIRPTSDVDSRWLMYALLSPQVRAQAEAGATGTAQRTVSLGVLRSMSIPRIGIEEQRQIATQVDAMSNSVARLKDIARAKSAALDELKKSLLHQAFTGAL